MAELRRDPILGQWAIVHTDDSLSPQEYEREERTPKQEATCQFCPGKEHQTPPEVMAIRDPQTEANTPGWQLRVVPNKFPALRIEGDIDRQDLGIFDISNGIGAHEVVVETTDHHKDLADFSKEELSHVITAYKERCVDLTRDKRFKYIMIFRNFGESAGASVEHPHSQIIGLPMVPKYVLSELEGAEEHYKFRGRNVYMDMLSQEFTDQERIVTENDDFVAFCPFVSRYPFECWIFPKDQSSRFVTMSETTQNHLAEILKGMLTRIKVCLSNPSYNFYFHIAPVNSEEPESFLWHIEIIPKLTRVAGFEWGTGLYTVKTDPKDAARYLREVM